MKSLRFIVIFLMLFTFSIQAFAVCETERDEYGEWHSKCEKLSAASQVTGVVGGFFALATFGASMAPCAATSVAALNACRIKDEKKKNLEECEAHFARLATEALEAAKKATAEANAKKERIGQINTQFAQRKATIIEQYNKMIEDFVSNYVAEGWNIEDPESQELLRTTRAYMEQERNQKLDQLEIDRKEAVSHA